MSDGTGFLYFLIPVIWAILILIILFVIYIIKKISNFFKKKPKDE